MRWSRFEPLDNHSPGPRTGHTAITLQDKMYLFGGETGSKCTNDLWRFDIANKTWTKIAPAGDAAPAPRCGHAAVAYGNVFLVFGGADRL